MKIFTKPVLLLLIVIAAFFGQTVNAQSVLDPNDAVVTYSASAPPTEPAYGQIGKWVRTKRLSWTTTQYKCYIYKGNAFRLMFPKSYNPTANDGKTYPLTMMMHGAGEAAAKTDNEYCLYHGGDVHLAAENNGKYDGYVLFMQTGSGWGDGAFDALKEIIDYMVINNKLDPFRVNVHGLSAGGQGAWNFMVKYPTYIAGGLPMSGTNIGYKNNDVVQSLKFTSIWDFQGGLDGSPAPSTSEQVKTAFDLAGGNLKHTVYADLGHGTWDRAYTEADFFPFQLRSHKANPWALGGRTEFCPGDVINITLGVTPGFNGYEWRKDGVQLAATGNTIQVTSPGVYDCRVLRGSLWSAWSPIPANVRYKGPTVSPTITLSGVISKVLPTPDTASVVLSVPSTYATYQWQKVGTTTTLSTTNTLTTSTPGDYAVKVTEQFGCSSDFSAPFTVVNSAGTPKPDPAIGLGISAISKTALRLDWSNNPNPQTDETNFEVYMATSAGGNYKLLHIKNANVLSDTASGLNSNTTYFFKVRAVGNTGAAALTSEASGTTQADVLAPSAPTNLSVAGSTRSSIYLSWTPSTDDVGVTNYDVYVNGAKSYTTSSTTFTVYNLVYSQSYTFAVRARDFANNTSPFSNQISATPVRTGLEYKYYTYDADETWAKLPDFGTLTPALKGMVTTVVTTPKTQTTRFAFKYTGFINIPTTGSYLFRLTASAGARMYLGALGSTTDPYDYAAVLSTTAAPTTLIVDNDGSHSSANKNSASMSLQAGIYPITITYYQATGTSALTASWDLPGGSTSYVTIPNSAFSDAAVTNGNAPDAPSDPAAVAASYSKINLSWTDNSDDETGFEIWRSTSKTTGFTTVGFVGANVTSFADSFSLNPATTYYYRIRSVGQYGQSAFVPIGTDAQAQWRLNNNYADSSGHNTKALASSGSPTFDASDKQEGTHAVNLNGTSQYLDIQTAAGDFTRGSYTAKSIAFWMKSGSNTGGRNIIDLGGADNGLGLRLDVNTLIAGAASGNTRKSFSVPYTSTGWNHIALVYSVNTLRLYVNGVLAGSNDALGFNSIGTTTNGSRIGYVNGTNAFNTGTARFQGKLDNIAIFGRGLSTGEISKLMDNTYGFAVATTQALPTTPAAATGLVASGSSTSGVHISWTDVATNEDKYEIYRSATTNDNYILLSTLPANATSYDDGGLFANSTFYYKVRAVNIGGASAYSSEDSALTNNNIPTLPAIADQYGHYGTTITVAINATDADPETLNVSTSALPSFGSYASNGNGTGVLTFTPDQSQQGTYPVTVTVADQHNGVVTRTFNVVVNDNYNPVIAAVSNVSVNESQTAQISLSATDANAGDAISWTFTGLPAFATAVTNGASATISLAPGYADNGTYNVTATVSDGHNGSDNKSFVITVNDVNPSKKIYVNFSGTVDANVTAPAPWNNTAKGPVLNDSVRNLKDYAGNATTIGLKILSSWQSVGGGYNASGAVTNNNTGVYPDNVLRGSWWTDTRVQSFKIYGLTVGTKYNFTFLGSRSGAATDNRTTVFTIKGISVQQNAAANTMNTVGVPALLPDSDGTLTLTLKPGTGAANAYINAMVIESLINDSSLPASPRNITAALSNGQVQLGWTDAAYNETGYEVYRATSQAGPYTALNAGATNANAVSYADATVSGSSTYYYAVRSINAFGTSPFSDTVSITTNNTAPILATISNVSLVAQQVLDVPVTATDNTGDVISLTDFNLPSFATFVDNGNGNGLLHFAPGYTLGTFTNITIAATDNKGATSTKVFTVTVAPADPNAPTGLKAAGISQTSVTLKWVDNAATETGYEVWRSTSPTGTFTQVATLGSNVTTYTDGGLTAGILYYYEVRAVVSGSFTAYSNIAGASGVMNAVYINFNDADAAPLPWNNTMRGPLDQDVYELNNDLGQASGETMTVIGKAFTGLNHTGMNTGNNSGIYPDNVMKMSWFTDAGAVGQVQMGGLNQAMNYTVTFFGSRDGNGAYADRTTKFTAAGKSVLLNAINNISYTGQVYNIKPDENGTILLSVQNASASPYGYMGAVIVQGYMSDGLGAGNDSYVSADTIINNNRTTTAPAATLSRTTGAAFDASATLAATESKIAAYPNPFTDDVNLTITTASTISKLGIKVYDISGRPVLTKELENVIAGTSTVKIGLNSRLTPGIYFLQVKNADTGKVQTIKLLRQ